MANLLITILAILLVAVMALMGVFYGGAAYQEGQLKGRANKIIGDMQQIKAAYQAYRAQTGDWPTATTTLNGSDFLTTGGFLSSVPTPGAGVSTTNLYYIRSISALNVGLQRTRVTVTLSDIDICYMLNRIIHESEEPGRWQNADSTWAVYKDSQNQGKLDRLLRWSADCFYQDNDGDSTYDSGEPIVFHMIAE